ncbi:oxygenase MpaB family protein [Streptomyces sp. NPDC049954]|uniref:oxygenase MpaB family protein n=1 Tax=Streptomyces sp. NPDC049954 TaxID=3155779 RepID=UPI003416406E
MPSSSRSSRASRPEPVPPPPGGVLWSVAGDIRSLLLLPAALILQVAHPAVGAGVNEYSVFRTDPWGRGARSLASVQLWVYGGDEAVAEGRRLRRLHREIRGTDTLGRPYRALAPDTYAWVHATGFPVYRHGLRLLARPLTPAQERQLYAEWRQVGRVLGLRERDLPRTVEEFWPTFHRVLAAEIGPNQVVHDLLSVDLPVPPPGRGPRLLRLALRALWPLLLPPLLRLRRFLTVGYLPPEARAALGLEWSERQERRLRRLSTVLRLLVPALPERLRYLPRARSARAAARRAGDTHARP